MKHTHNRVCPVEAAGSLDNRFRRWIQNPVTVLAPYIKPGMTILDIGCGPGFFTMDMARLTGENGHVVAADLQQEMLDKVARKIKGTDLANRITLHRCQQDKIGYSGKFDFIFAFYMVHEVPDKDSFLHELSGLMHKNGQLLIIEPKFHVSGKAFDENIDIINNCGFTVVKKRSSWFQREILAVFSCP